MWVCSSGGNYILDSSEVLKGLVHLSTFWSLADSVQFFPLTCNSEPVMTSFNVSVAHKPIFSVWSRNNDVGLPWWRSGWESACQCRGHGFKPWSGKFPHAAEQLGPWATITAPARLEPVLRNKRGRDSERPVHCDEEWPPLAATRESPRTETKTQHRQK